MRDLPERVNTGIRAPGSMNDHARGIAANAATKLGQRSFQKILHRATAGLALPPTEGSAVVSDDELETDRR